jgi:hypothetical protein
VILGRLPAWATTGVGSLPHDDVAEAVEHVTTAYDIPFCPQLPRLEGDMVTEWLGADPRRCGWSPDRDRERPRAWDALLARLDDEPPGHGVVKLQVTGPVTLAHALGDASLVHELALWLAANAGGQVRALAERGLDALLVVDEPALHLAGPRSAVASPPAAAASPRPPVASPPAAAASPRPAVASPPAAAASRCDAAVVWDPLRAVAPAWGLHLCGPVPWDVVERAEPDVLSFDVTLGPPDERVLQRIVQRGGRIAWGVLAPHRSGVHFALPPGDGADSLLTAACGTGRMSLARELEIARALRSVRADS